MTHIAQAGASRCRRSLKDVYKRQGQVQPAQQPLTAVHPGHGAPQLQALHLLDTGQLPPCEEGQQGLQVQRWAIGQAQAGGLRCLAACPAQLRGVEAVALGKGGVEAAQALEAAGQRHLRHWQRRVGEQLLGQQQALCRQVVQRRHTVRGLSLIHI